MAGVRYKPEQIVRLIHQADVHSSQDKWRNNTLYTVFGTETEYRRYNRLRRGVQRDQ